MAPNTRASYNGAKPEGAYLSLPATSWNLLELQSDQLIASVAILLVVEVIAEKIRRFGSRRNACLPSLYSLVVLLSARIQ